MSTFLTDSMARDHATTMQAAAQASRRAHLARRASRDARRSERLPAAGTQHHRVSSVGHAAVRPLAAVRHWLVAGQL